MPVLVRRGAAGRMVELINDATARALVASGKAVPDRVARNVFLEIQVPQVYLTRHMEAAPAPMFTPCIGPAPQPSRRRAAP